MNLIVKCYQKDLDCILHIMNLIKLSIFVL